MRQTALINNGIYNMHINTESRIFAGLCVNEAINVIACDAKNKKRKNKI